MTAGDQLLLTISDIAFGGEGVARLEHFVLFVPFVALGEEVEAEVVEVKKRFARCRLLRVVKPAPERVQPECSRRLQRLAQQGLGFGGPSEANEYASGGNLRPRRATPVAECSIVIDRAQP